MYVYTHTDIHYIWSSFWTVSVRLRKEIFDNTSAKCRDHLARNLSMFFNYHFKSIMERKETMTDENNAKYK